MKAYGANPSMINSTMPGKPSRGRGTHTSEKKGGLRRTLSAERIEERK